VLVINVCGRKQTEETKKKISEAKTGKKIKPFTDEHKRKISKALTGRKHPRTKEWQRKITESLKGKKPWNFCENSYVYCDECGGQFHKKPCDIKRTKRNFCSSECSKLFFGRSKNNPNWKGGKVSLNDKIRASPEYAQWRFEIFERDNFKCQWCGADRKKLNAHHIKPFCDFPNLRLDIDNAITLCVDCHERAHGRPLFSKKTKSDVLSKAKASMMKAEQ